MNEIGKDNCAWGIFVDFEKAFGTVDHHTLLRKLEYYGVIEVISKWFASYLSKKKQFGTFFISYRLKWFTFDSKIIWTHHFTDYTNLLNFQFL